VTDWNYGSWTDDDWVDDDVWTDDDDAVEPPATDDTTVPADDVADDVADDTTVEEPTVGVYVYTVTANGGFAAIGYIDHTDYEAEAGSDYFDLPVVHRSVVIGDYLYTISDAALVVTKIEGLETVASDDLPYFYDYYWGDDDWVDDGWGGDGETVPAK